MKIEHEMSHNKQIQNFNHLKEQVQSQIDRFKEEIHQNEKQFKFEIQDAFNNFKVSTELEQTKRMRQIGDFVTTQQRLLSQISFNDKNYQIFQKTSE